MHEPSYFDYKADTIIEIYRKLEDYILSDTASRLLKAGEMSGTADYYIWKLQQMGEQQSVILSKLSKLTGLSRKELKKILEDSVLTSWKDDLSTYNQLGIEVSDPLKNKSVMSVINSEYKKTINELSNLTLTTMNKSQSDLMQMLDEAEIMTASGIKSYSAAVCDILDRYAGKGVMVEYPNGTHRTIEAAVRLCVVTSLNQTAAQVTNQYIKEAKAEYVLTSAHVGARTQREGQPFLAGHDNWQGKVYKIVGSEEGYPNLLECTGYDIDIETGMGKVVNPLGLHGYGCRHSHKAWDKRLKNPYENMDLEENEKKYNLLQKQRAYERKIRSYKRQLLVKQKEIDMIAETDVKSILQQDYDKLAYKLRKANSEYNDFCEKNELPKQYDRIKVSGFGAKQASKANGRATAYQNSQ